MPPLVVGKVMGSYISQAQIINKNIKLVPTGAMCKAEIVEVGKMSLAKIGATYYHAQLDSQTKVLQTKSWLSVESFIKKHTNNSKIVSEIQHNNS